MTPHRALASDLIPSRATIDDVEARLGSLRSALASSTHVRGFTHAIYRYPARFSPEFVATAIENLAPDDGLVVNPFVGGGTTAIEALARGRRLLRLIRRGDVRRRAGSEGGPWETSLTRPKPVG